MNCEEIKNNMLLAQSGELPDAQLKDLKRHLEECEDCKKYDHLLNLISANTAPYNNEGPSPATMTVIHDAIFAENTQKPVMVLPFSARILAYAALITMLIGGALLLPNESDQAARINSLKDLMAVVCDEDTYILESNQSDDPDSELRMLAEQLLRYQEGSEENFIDQEYLPLEPDPTALQFRNTPELLHQKCV